jgi:predicted nucleic acid-binding protein
VSRFVIDASVALTYLLSQEEGALYAQRSIEALCEHGAVARPIWPLEVANAAVVHERRGNLSASQVERFFEAVLALPVAIIDGADVFGATTILARRWQRSVYDAQYLELSLRLDLPLASLDRGLLQAAKGAGVLLAEF